MLNRPINLFNESTADSRSGPGSWHVDQNPTARLLWLLILMVVPLTAVTGRLIYLQGSLGEKFVTDVDRTIETFEPIPSRDGRILASDGKVLAYDVERFSVLMHYRWLEEPVDEKWWKQQSLSRLSRADRRNPQLVADAQQQVLELRRKMWQRLAELTETEPNDLTKKRAAIQKRIERIMLSVDRHRLQKKQQQKQQKTAKPTPANEQWWQTIWKTVIAALTTPPERSDNDPIIVQEELDYHVVIDDVSLQIAAKIESRPEQFPGLRIELTTHRDYPEGPLAPHIVGYRRLIDNDELETRLARFPNGDPLDYRPGDIIGKTGVELSYDRHLHGLRGLRKVIKNRRGEVLRTETVREPRIGHDIMLTLDVPLQQQTEQLLDQVLGDVVTQNDHKSTGGSVNRDNVGPTPRGGCIIALDVHTGAILAAAAAPRYNLQMFVDSDRGEWQRATSDPRQPFFPRATQMTLPPGSVFKTLTAVALLESGQIEPQDTIFCRGYLDTPEKYRCYIFRHYGVGHHDMNLSDALCQSCNVYFFGAARSVGAGPIVHWAKRFGFGRKTGIDLPRERAGNLPMPPGDKGKIKLVSGSRQTHWYPGDTLGLAIGQSRLTVTPLQIARLMAAIANGGYLVTPHVVDQTSFQFSTANGKDVSNEANRSFGSSEIRFQPQKISGLSQTTLKQIRGGLKKVVAHPKGTGYKRVRLKEIEIAGKTGTAEVGGGKPDHAWFAGYVPADSPRVAFVVVLEHAGSGGRVAGPVARQFIQLMLDQKLLRPTQVTTQD